MPPEIAVEMSNASHNFDPVTANFLSNMVFFMFPFMIWELVWKGIALWKAARNGHKYWYIAILILNTVGILPIVYVLLYKNSKKK